MMGTFGAIDCQILIIYSIAGDGKVLDYRKYAIQGEVIL